jgi:membrane protein insertase Oxa1/YidC/SpoIIIJ
MYGWHFLTELFRETLFALSHACGSMGFAIAALSLVVRIASFPIRIRLKSRRGRFWKGVIAIPFAAALYSVVREAARTGGRFLWIRNLSRPDALLGLVGALIAAIAALTSPVSQQTAAQGMQRVAMIVPILITFLVASKVASGVGVYWIASSAVSTGERMLARRRGR